MYIIFDLDDTVLNCYSKIDDFTLCTLRYFQNKGHKLVINTARSLRNTLELINIIKPDYSILYGGSMIVDKNKEIIFSSPIKKNTLNLVIKDIINDVKAISVETKDEIFTSDESYNAPYFDFKNKEFNEDAYKLLFCVIDDGLITKICDKYNLNSVTYRNLIWHRFMPKNTSKFLGIVNLLKLTNGSLDECITFGDDYGDIEMINNSKVGVIMKNAYDDVKKQIKGYECDTNNNYGVARFLLNYLKER